MDVNGRKLLLPKSQSLTLLLLVILIFTLVATSPVAEAASDSCDPDTKGVCLCNQVENTEGTNPSDPIKTFFTILSVLGPVFATLFFVGMSVADAAKMKGDYKEDRRRVLILGFSVPIAISFLEVIGSEIVGQRIDCFFP